MTITLPPQERETPPAMPRSIQVWFQPQQIGKCKGCRATIVWRTTVKNQRPIPFDPEPRLRDDQPPDPRGRYVINRFHKVGAELRRDGDKVDVLNANYAHWASCPVQQRFRRRKAAAAPKPVEKPIEVPKPAPAQPSLFEE